MKRRARLSLDAVTELTLDQLRAEWMVRIGTPCPSVAADLLRAGLAYHLQERQQGGLSRSTRTFLRRIGGVDSDTPDAKSTPLPRKLTPGTRLVRDWHGTGHSVTVLEDGFEYAGTTWKSLSAIAREITGARWNGPRFFGLAERTR